MKSIRLATAWLSGCSGCHMSLLNLHQGLLEILAQFDLVYSPLMDLKEYPPGVDIVLVEGAVANEENRGMAQIIRQRTKVVISLGDCAVNGNVSALRNPAGCAATVERSYGAMDWMPELNRLTVPVLPLHQVVRVDAFIPGCPPEPELIRQTIVQSLGRS
ncbi:MAG: NADP oxidoreductase [Geobacteraceae bacterium]|nr:NADP oxidoreductase [Geobacteraceae bacterium]